MNRGDLRSQVRRWSLIAIALTVPAVAGLAAQAPEQGDVEGLIERGGASYRAHCASCHGLAAKGEGVLAPYLVSAPPDLTQISSRDQGVFPFEEIYDIVDGREVPGHGTRAMPVWGPALMGISDTADKKMVKEKVVELVYYLKSLQPALAQPSPKMGEAH